MNPEAIPRLLSVRDFGLLYGYGRGRIRKLIEDGHIKAVPGDGPMRIYDPAWSAAAGHTMTGLEDLYILKGADVATLLGVTIRRVRQLAEEGRLEFKDVRPGKMKGFSRPGSPGLRRYSVSGVQKLMEEYERQRHIKKDGSRPWLVEFARQKLRAAGLNPK